MKNKKLYDAFRELNAHLHISQLLLGEPLKNHTTFKIGGPADLFVCPRNLPELSYTMKVLHKWGLEATILGGGSNVLVLDKGVRGILVCTTSLRHKLSEKDGLITAAAGRTLKEVSQFAHGKGLTGLEFAIGIPGTIGGAIYMNAGAYGAEMKGIVTKVRTVDLTGQIREYTNEECHFDYRKSLFQENGEIIAEIDMQLAPGNRDDILATMEDLTFKRESKQPLEWPSAGSTFKRPPGYFAGTLIDETGLKGLSVGDAQVSEKHAGFIINKGDATAQDVLDLIKEVQRRIKEAHGVDLEREVQLMGED